ncbi:MAG: hypothetical protein WBC91_11730 [Phototrophicaceae bacterium]
MNKQTRSILLIMAVLLIFTMPLAASSDETRIAIGEATPEPSPLIPILNDQPSMVDVTGKILRFSGQFESDDDEIIVQFIDLSAGDVIYAYAAGIGRVDTYMYVLNESLTDVFVEDNNSGGGFNAALSYEVEVDGTYLIGLITREQIGRFELVVGVNTPEIISVIDQAPTDDLATTFEPFTCDDAIFSDRPVLSGNDLTYEADAFVIHYTDSGRDAASIEWITELAIALQLSLDTQLNDLGWALPPADCGEGGDTRLDVYVHDIDFALGIATPENLVGDNPNTPVVEYYAAYSYLVVENDIDYERDREFAFNAMRTTAAHEVHHNIQFGYDVNDRFFAFYEAGATWIETLVYPELTNAGANVSPLFNTPDLCLGAFNGRGNSRLRVYGEWVLIDSFTRDLGIESYQFIWEYLSENEGLEGFYRALEALNTTPQDVVMRMAVRNLLRDYALGAFFESTVDIETTLDSTGSITSSRDGVQQLGVDYVQITAMDVYDIRLDTSDNFALWLVGIDRETDLATVYDLGAGGVVDTRPYTDAYVIILNTQQHRETDNCTFADWKLDVSEAQASDSIASTGEIWNASRFVVAD